MKYLLDTHALLWFLNNDKQLKPYTLAVMQNADVLYISVVSLWEIAIKYSLGKLKLPFDYEQIFPYQLNANDITVLPIDVHHIYVINHLPFYHRDPFDRLIIAQARAENLPVISKDKAFTQYDIECVW